MTEAGTPPPKRVRRGEGEVTEWPRGLVEYVPSGVPEATPDPGEDRTRNRLELAGRLIALLRAQGQPVDRELRELRSAQAAFDAGDRSDARDRVEQLLGELELRERLRDVGSTETRDPLDR